MRSHGQPSFLTPCLVCQRPFRRTSARGNTHYCSRKCYFIGRKLFVVAMTEDDLRRQILERGASIIRLAA